MIFLTASSKFCQFFFVSPNGLSFFPIFISKSSSSPLLVKAFSKKPTTNNFFRLTVFLACLSKCLITFKTKINWPLEKDERKAAGDGGSGQLLNSKERLGKCVCVCVCGRNKKYLKHKWSERMKKENSFAQPKSMPNEKMLKQFNFLF